MNVCLEGPKTWEWFDFDVENPDSEELSPDNLKKVLGTENPVITDTEYDDNLDDLFDIDDYGYTTISELQNQARSLDGLASWEIEEIAAYKRVKGGSLEDALNDYDKHIYLYADDDRDVTLGYAYVELSGDISPELMSRYFDYSALGVDLLASGYEPEFADENDEYAVGEEYIDAYGGVDAYIYDNGVDENLFDFESYGRDLSFGFTYDDISKVFVSESLHQKRKPHKPTVEKLTLKKHK